MPGEYPGFNPEQAHENLDRSVIIDKRILGREYSKFKFRELIYPPQETVAWTDVFIDTTSGNMYHIDEVWLPDGSERFTVTDARTNKGRPGKKLLATALTRQQIENMSVTVGKPFEYAQGGRTTDVTRITALNRFRRHDTASLQEETGGVTSDVIDRWRAALR